MRGCLNPNNGQFQKTFYNSWEIDRLILWTQRLLHANPQVNCPTRDVIGCRYKRTSHFILSNTNGTASHLQMRKTDMYFWTPSDALCGGRIVMKCCTIDFGYPHCAANTGSSWASFSGMIFVLGLWEEAEFAGAPAVAVEVLVALLCGCAAVEVLVASWELCAASFPLVI